MATGFNTQVGNGEYRLQFETDNREYYLLMQETARCCVDVKPMTNADRIRAMNDEELAVAISRGSNLDLCNIVCGGDCKAVATFNKTSQQRCAEIVLEWLQQPAEGE